VRVCATAVSKIEGVTAVVMPLTTSALVEFTELTLVTPVAFARLTVTVFVFAVRLTTSIPVMFTGVTLLISVALIVSIPVLPDKTSLACQV
jgi:hypothetical protein